MEKIIDEVNYFYIGDEYKNLVGKIQSVDGDLDLTNFNNQNFSNKNC